MLDRDLAGIERIDALLVDVEADDLDALPERRECERDADIAETDDPDHDGTIIDTLDELLGH